MVLMVERQLVVRRVLIFTCMGAMSMPWALEIMLLHAIRLAKTGQLILIFQAITDKVPIGIILTTILLSIPSSTVACQALCKLETP